MVTTPITQNVSSFRLSKPETDNASAKQNNAQDGSAATVQPEDAVEISSAALRELPDIQDRPTATVDEALKIAQETKAKLEETEFSLGVKGLVA